MVNVQDRAPGFTLPSTNGSEIALESLRGKKVVLYFYPRDDTPGCTVEACDFRDNLARLVKHGVVVLGVSKDSLASHARFRAKHALPFDLLSDADSAVAKSYGAYGQKLMYGKPVVGTIRSTVLIDEQGRIAALWSPVKVAGHVDAVIAALGAGSSATPAGERAAKAPARPAARKPSSSATKAASPAGTSSRTTSIRKTAAAKAGTRSARTAQPSRKKSRATR